MFKKIAGLAAAGFIGLWSGVSAQQYTVHSWHNFERGIPSDLSLAYWASTRTVLPFNFMAPGLPPSMTTPQARSELGGIGVRLVVPSEKQNNVAIFSPITLERARLGGNGAALFQADIYIPEVGTPMPTTSLLAAAPNPSENSKLPYAFYRFGVQEGGESVFFSFTNNTPAPLIYESQPMKELSISRPGWHRFAIIFKGQNEIQCAVDGKPTEFSPIKESTLTHLNAGLWASSSKVHPIDVVADNLSIQWTGEDAPLPDSPWLDNAARATVAAANEGGSAIWETTQAGSVAPGTAPADQAASLLEDNPHISWHTDPATAWQSAQAQNRPLLVMFYAPRIEPYAYLKSIVPNDETGQAFLGKYTLLKVDANQLAGGALAQERKIIRLPTFLIFGTDGQEKKQVPVLNRQTTWQQLQSDLTVQ